MTKTPLTRRAILAGSAATAAALAAPALAQATREFRIGMITPPAHVWNQESTALNATLREMSNNRFGSVVDIVWICFDCDLRHLLQSLVDSCTCRFKCCNSLF